jgi:serine/threonine protein kinase
MDFLGRELGRYKIIEVIGEGGMASVYKGFDTRLDREVAIKIIRTNFGSKDILLKRFEREARVSAQLSHPNIVPIYDFGEFEGSPYIVMQLMPGDTLKSKIGTPMNYLDAIRLLLPIAQALGYAHKRGVIHRDVKPSNIVFNEIGNPMLSDFGIARLIEDDDVSGITASGMGIGTPEYMAPEQWQGKSVAQSDIYSFGVILFELITGKKPFTADTPAAILIKQANEPAPSPKKFIRNLPFSVEKVILKALAKNIEDRYLTIDGLISDLNSITDQPSTRSFKTSYHPVASPKPSNESTLLTQKNRNRFFRWILYLIIGLLVCYFGYQVITSINWSNIATSVWIYIIGLVGIIIVSLLIFNLYKGYRNRNSREIFNNTYYNPPKSLHRPTLNNIRNWQESGTMTVNVIAALNPDRQRNILQLIYREQELRLKDRLIYYQGGIRLVLHGFGRFGATAILNQIIEQAKIELASGQEKKAASSILAVRIATSDSLDKDSAFTAVIRELRFEAIRGKYASVFKSKINKLYNSQNVEVSESTTGNSFSIKAAPMPGIETSFSKNSGRSIKPKAVNITDGELMDAVTKILDRSESDPGILERTIDRLINNTNFPARVIVIIEKISDENVLLALRRIRLFEDSRISIFAIVQQEDFLNWSSEAISRIDRAGFKFHYVPCVWEEENHLIYKMLKEAYSSNINSEEIDEFLNYIAFVTKGAPGDVVREIVDHKYVTFSNGIPELALKDIRVRDREVIRYDAIREKILTNNWKKILSQGFSGSEQYDQARIGVYEIIDWMYRNVQFTIEEIILAAEKAKVPISSSKYVREKTIRVLISVMRKHRLLNSLGIGSFRVRPLFKIDSENILMRTDPAIGDTLG